MQVERKRSRRLLNIDTRKRVPGVAYVGPGKHHCVIEPRAVQFIARLGKLYPEQHG
jgi:hypothetical protein